MCITPIIINKQQEEIAIISAWEKKKHRGMKRDNSMHFYPLLFPLLLPFISTLTIMCASLNNMAQFCLFLNFMSLESYVYFVVYFFLKIWFERFIYAIIFHFYLCEIFCLLTCIYLDTVKGNQLGSSGTAVAKAVLI